MSALNISQMNRRAAQRQGNLMAEARALELEAKHPQLTMFSPSPPDTLHLPKTGGGDAGLARVIGHGKRKSKMEKEEPSDDEISVDSLSDVEYVGKGMSGGAKHQGVELGKHILQMHGKGFFDDFAKGFMSVIKPIASVASFIPGPIGAIAKGVSALSGGGNSETAHAMMAHPVATPRGAAGSDVPKGALAPIAFGNSPQAPASFKRNAVGMGRAGGGRAGGAAAGAGNLHIVHEGSGSAGGASLAGGAAKKRGECIKIIMAHKKVSLPEASKLLKQEMSEGKTLDEVHSMLKNS
jgi:hypothetical protein